MSSAAGTGSSGSGVTTGSLNIAGHVFGGAQPIQGATIQLYAVGVGSVPGSAGYSITAANGGAFATPLLTQAVTSSYDNYGSFALSSGTTKFYTCPTATTQVYLTATGGTTGGTTTANNAITLMAALGSCGNLTTNSFININEVSTVAAAYALAHFATYSRFGTTMAGQPGSANSAPADNITTSSGNTQGLANAMSVANVMANYFSVGGTGVTGYAPGNNVNGTATSEYWTINTVADIIASCINSGSSASSQCTQLFQYTRPVDTTTLNGNTIVAAADTFQAALYMALYPGDSNLLSGQDQNGNHLSGANLAGLISGVPPFQPYVYPDGANNVINDWTIAVSYAPVATGTTTTLLSVPYNLALDSNGNVWVNNTPSKEYAIELDPTGNPVLAGEAACSQYPAGGTQTGCSANDYQINAFHKQGGSGVAPIGSNSNPFSNPTNLAIDTSDNVWYIDRGTDVAMLIQGSHYTTSTTPAGAGNTLVTPYGAGAYPNGNTVFANGGGNKTQNHNFPTGYPVGYSPAADVQSGATTGTATAPLTGDPVGVVVDGTNHPWVTVNKTNEEAISLCSNQPTVNTAASSLETVSGFTVAYNSSNYFGYNGTVFYGGASGSGSNTLAIDPGSPNCTSSSTVLCNSTVYDKLAGSSTAIANSPFVWVDSLSSGTFASNSASTSGFIGNYYTGISTSNAAVAGTSGCETPIGQIGSADNTSAPPTTGIVSYNPTGSDQINFAAQAKGIAFGPANQIWFANNQYTDQNSTDEFVLQSFTPNFGSAFTSASFAAAVNGATIPTSTSGGFAQYSGGGLNNGTTGTTSPAVITGLVPQVVLTDGAGSPWVFGYSKDLASQPVQVHLNAAGAPLSTANGFLGTKYSNGGTTLTRTSGIGGYGGGIDGSGNVWMTNSGYNGDTAAATRINVYELVGAATPVVTPLSLGVKNGTVGMMP